MMAAFLMVRRWQAMKVATRAIINVEEEFRVLTRNLQETLDLQDEKLQNLEVCICCVIPFWRTSLNFKQVFISCVSKLSFWSSKSIFRSDQYVTLQKNFSHPSLVIYFFPTLPIKLKLGLQIGGRLLIANHLDQSLWLANQKQGAAVRSYLLHSSLAGVRLYCAYYQPQQTVRNCWARTILLSQTGMLWLFFIQC